jgi:NADH-quinone oxidoreductase subunit J
MSHVAFIVISVLTLAAGLAAACLSKLIHAALCLALSFIGVAAFYFFLGAEFVGLVQIFVYVGAVAVLIVFTILLTARDFDRPAAFKWSGAFVALAVFVALLWSIFKNSALPAAAPPVAALTVKQIGDSLMTAYIWPLLCIGLVLTAALVGALVLAMEEKSE